MDGTPDQPVAREPSGPVSVRMVVAILLGLLVLLFIVLNRQQTHVSFIVFSARAPLWLALAVVGACGFGAGLLFGRRRYKAPQA